ncbi:hypothetical protein HMPREF3291_11635 [Bacillus sp. HMSC76G11]|nr:hypothetical protein HMPREF3291_11635 [Bacillus sp. HMSC76G11]
MVVCQYVKEELILLGDKLYKGELCEFFLLFTFVSIFISCCSLSFGCPDGEIEWIHIVKIKDIKYQHDYPKVQIALMKLIQTDRITYRKKGT